MTYIQNEIVEINRNPAVDLIHSVRLASGEVIGCGQVVNTYGPRAAKILPWLGLIYQLNRENDFRGYF